MDALRKYTLNVSLDLKQKIPIPEFIVGDTNVIEFKISQNGLPADLSTSGKIVVNFIKNDETVISRLLTDSVNGDTVTYTLGSEETEQQGKCFLELQIYSLDNTQRVSTTRVQVTVLDGIGTDEIITSDPEYTTLQTLFMDFDQRMSTMDDVNSKADQTYVDNQLDSVNAQLAENMNNTKNISILNFGGNPDGVTDNTTAYNGAVTLADGNRPIYFPQNASNNAVYYFSGNVDFGDVLLNADDGVKISVSSSNNRTYKNTKFLTSIEIVSRDRDNIGIQEPSYAVPNWLVSLSNATEQMGMIDVDPIDFSTWEKTTYDTRIDTQQPHALGTASGGDYTIITGSASGGNVVSSVVHSVETDAVLNKEYEGWFNHDTGRVGITVKFSGGWGLFSTENSTGKIFLGKRTIGGSWSEFEVIIPGMTSAYFLSNSRGIQLSARVIEDAVEFYINGAYANTIKGMGTVEKIGYGIGGSSIVNGITSPEILYAVSGHSPKRPKGRPLKIAVYGDSISFGEGANLDWPSLLKDALKSIPQFTRIDLRNSAVSGQRAAQQLDVLNAEGVSGYNYTLVMVGTNDIQTQTYIPTYRQNLIDIISKIRADGSQPIIGVPPVFIDKDSTGYGFSTSNYEKGSEYRAVVYRVCAEQGVLVADVMSYLGLVDAQNTVYRDNIHPQSFANTYIAQSFAKSIFNHFQKI